MTENPTTTMVYRHSGQERQQLTAVWRNGGCSASYDSFVVGSSAVLRLNFCAKNPPLRQAAKRYQTYEKSQSKKQKSCKQPKPEADPYL